MSSDPELGVRLALTALDTSPTEEAGVALRQTTQAFYPYTALDADSVHANTAAYSPDGERVVTGGDDGVATIWDVATHRARRAVARRARRGARRALLAAQAIASRSASPTARSS